MTQEGRLPDGSIMVETDLFEHREVKPHFINACCFGEDFAAWLMQELSRSRDLGMELAEPIQEDYGWGFWASRDKDRIWVALSFAGDEANEAAARWVISVAYDPGLNPARRMLRKPDEKALGELRRHVQRALESDSAIKIVATRG